VCSLTREHALQIAFYRLLNNVVSDPYKTLRKDYGKPGEKIKNPEIRYVIGERSFRQVRPKNCGKNQVSHFHVHVHLRERDLNSFLCKAPGNPAIDRILHFIGEVVFPSSDLEDKIQTGLGKRGEENRG
jgi:hypothetical protein